MIALCGRAEFFNHPSLERPDTTAYAKSAVEPQNLFEFRQLLNLGFDNQITKFEQFSRAHLPAKRF